MGKEKDKSIFCEDYLQRFSVPFACGVLFAAISFSAIHYSIYMSSFSGGMLLLYAPGFFLDFTFLLSLHFAIGLFTGRLFYSAGFWAILIGAMQLLSFRKFPFGRRLMALVYKATRSEATRVATGYAFGILFVLITYVGVVRGLALLAFLLLFLIGSANAYDRKRLLEKRFMNLGAISIRKFFGLFKTAAFWEKFFIVRVFSLKRGSVLAQLSLLILLLAFLSGIARADFITSNIEMRVSSGEKEYLGIVYASSSSGILFFEKETKSTIFFPTSDFKVFSKGKLKSVD